MSMGQRTDLASEARDLWRESSGETSALEGVKAWQENRDGFTLDVVEVLDERGEFALCKPRGRYSTLRLEALERREEDAFERGCRVLSGVLREALGLMEG